MTYPWDKPFEARAAQLLSRPKRVMYYAVEPNPGSFRYRVFNMVSILERQTADVSASYFFESDGSKIYELLSQVDRLVIHRTRYTDFAARLILYARHCGVPVFYDIDDYTFDAAAVPMLVSTLNQMPPTGELDDVWDAWFGWAGRFHIMMMQSDKIITTTKHLAHLAGELTGKPTAVVRNCLSYDELELSERAYSEKERHDFAADPFVIGYFSGTNSHQRDLRTAAPGIIRTLEKYPKSRLVLVGHAELDTSEHPELANRIHHHDLVDYRELPELIASVDVNIAPLLINDFTNSKSELKYFSAAAVGVPTIASDTVTMQDAISSGENSWLANSGEWEEVLEQAINCPADDFYALTEIAHSDALENYSPQRVARELLEALELSDASK